MKIVINEYAEYRSRALLRWFPEAEVCQRYQGEQTPASFDLLILSGGPGSAHEAARRERPFLDEDKRLLEELRKSEQGGPFVLGICLGGQLMADTFGGHVEDGSELLLGWNEITILKKHPIYEGIDTKLLQCEIHSNHITRLPRGAELLASSTLDSIEAFSIGNRFVATGYHPEFTKDDIEWFATVPKLDLKFLDTATTLTLDDGYAASERFFTNVRSLV